MKALCINQDPCRQIHRFLVMREMMMMLMIVRMTMMMTRLAETEKDPYQGKKSVATQDLSQIHSPQSRKDPHGRADKLNKEKSSSEVGRHVEEGVCVHEQVGHPYKDDFFMGMFE